MTALIGVDWGTSNCRAFRIARDGAVLEARAAAKASSPSRAAISPARSAAMLGDWLAAHDVPVLMSGMIGSRQGWVEAPYVELPGGCGTDRRRRWHRCRSKGGRCASSPASSVRGSPAAAT